MFELGEYAVEEHKKIVSLLKEKNLSKAILVGAEFSKIESDYKTFSNTNDCLNYLRTEKFKGYTILIKGSRGMKLEILKDVL